MQLVSAETMKWRAVKPSRHSNRIGLTAISNLVFMQPFLKFTEPKKIMAKDNEVSMPSSQGGLVQYMDADTGIEVDPKTVIAFGFLVSILGIGLHL